MAEVKQLQESDFEQGIKEGKVLVDFWAPWCGPCKMMAPVLEDLAAEQEEVTVAKVNVDDNPQVAARFGIMSIPTLILFSDGQETEKLVGFMDKTTLKSRIGL